MSNKAVKEKDIIQFINDSVLSSGLYGYGNSLSEEEITASDKLMEIIEPNVSREDYMKIEEHVNKLIDVSESAGFKRGFHIAMKIVLDGSK